MYYVYLVIEILVTAGTLMKTPSPAGRAFVFLTACHQ
jgi:hypothetical protein